MGSIFSSRNSIAVKSAAKAALEAACAGAVAACLAGAIWPEDRRAIVFGVGAAWAASTVGASALIVAKTKSPEAFWWAFGAGMALRVVVLLVLVGWSVARPYASQAGLLLSYALGVLAFLLLEYRHIKDK